MLLKIVLSDFFKETWKYIARKMGEYVQSKESKISV